VNFTAFDKNYYLLGEAADEDVVHRLAKLSQGWYIVLKENNHWYINDMRFGQIGMTDDPDSFPFSHELWYEDGNLQVKQRERNRENIGQALGSMFKRVSGK
jgi:inner membrane protein